MDELGVWVVVDQTADHTVSYDGRRLVLRPDAQPADVGRLLMALVRLP